MPRGVLTRLMNYEPMISGDYAFLASLLNEVTRTTPGDGIPGETDLLTRLRNAGDHEAADEIMRLRLAVFISAVTPAEATVEMCEALSGVVSAYAAAKIWARMLEVARAAEPTKLPDPCEALCRECKSDGVCIKKNPFYREKP